ncbi:hypothetical protein U9M48_031060, partial [Paspalum notatum var. saurae]
MDLFKASHYSKKKGYSDAVQEVIIENGHKSEQELRATITSQQEEMLDLKQKVEEANASNKRNEDEMAILKQKQETIDSLLL